MGQTLMTSMFRHKAWVNAGLFDAFAAGDKDLAETERRAAIRTLNHIYVVDRIFAAHLQGTRHGYAGTNTPETPALDQLSKAMRENDRWYLDYVAKVSPKALAETIAFTFTDGARGSMSREEMLAHVVSHGSYHRGQVSRMLPAAVSDAGPDDLLTAYLHQAEPARRG